MKKLTEKDKREYLYQNYTKVDGLWFIKVEENYGFDRALELDKEVWQVLPKIQARFLKKRLELKNSMDDLLEALRIKMELDGFKINAGIKSIKAGKKKSAPAPAKILQVEITDCPWHDIMIKAKRENLSEKIGSLICRTEYSTFAKEFNKDFEVEIKDQICGGYRKCLFRFYENI